MPCYLHWSNVKVLAQAVHRKHLICEWSKPQTAARSEQLPLTEILIEKPCFAIGNLVHSLYQQKFVHTHTYIRHVNTHVYTKYRP